MPVGGDILELTCSHETVGTVRLLGKAAEDSTFDLGGLRSSDDMNMIDGGGNMIDQMNRSRWCVECVISHDMNVKQELDKLNQLSGSPLPGVWTITHINGTVYRGTGKPVGDMKGNGNQATIALKISGGGVLKKIA